MSGRGCLAALFLLASVGACDRRPAASDAFASTTAAHARLDSLRTAARFEDALPLATAVARRLRLERAADWRVRDAEREVATLRRLSVLPSPAREEWRRCHEAIARTRTSERANAAATVAALERWLGFVSQCLGPESVEAADALAALAFVHEQQSNLARARDLDRRALDIRLRIHGPRHPDVAESLDRLAYDIKRALGTTSEVMEYTEQALAIRRDLLGTDSREYGASLLRRANYHRVRREIDAARRDFVAAERIFARAGGDSSPGVAEVLTDHGLTLGQIGRWEEAEPLLQRAARICRAQTGPPDVVHALALNQLGVALRELGRCDEARRVLQEAAAVQEERRRRATPDHTRHAIFQVVAYRDLALTELCLGRPTEAWVALERASSRGAVEAAQERGDLAPGVDPFAGLLSRVQTVLPDSAAIIGWVDRMLGGGTVADWPSWCFVVRNRGTPRWVRVDRPPDADATPLKYRLTRFTARVEIEANWPLRAPASMALEDLGREIYALRMAPMESLLAGVRTLIVASPEMNHVVPIEALVDAQGRAVAERFVTFYSPSALLYAVGRERNRRNARPRDWSGLLVGNPTNSDSLSAWAALRPLGRAEDEIRSIAGRLAAADVLVGRGATEAALDSLRRHGLLEKYAFIHIATHAEHDRGTPMWSALLLAEARHLPPDAWLRGAPEIDGRLTVDEIRREWRLDADLVNLATCRGLAPSNAIVDGPFGIGTAFLDAGARSLLASMFTVDDEASELLFRRFAAAYLDVAPARRDAAAALRTARLALRDHRAADGSQPYRSPVYWAGFVLVGTPD